MPCRRRSPRRFIEQAGRGPAGRPARTELPAMLPAFPLRWKIVAGCLRLSREGEARDRVIVWPQDLPVGRLPAASDRCRGGHRRGAADRRRRQQAFGGDFDRCWLLAVQLYGVRSARNWGIGDFTDLAGLIELAASSGRRRRRPQSAACVVRRPPRRLQPLFAEQPAVSQRALYRRRKTPGISAPTPRRAATRSRGCGRATSSIIRPSPT